MKIKKSNELIRDLYLFFPTFIILIIIFIKKFNFIQIEAIDFEIFQKIVNENPQKDKLKYDPHYHFNYLISYIFYILNKNLSITVSAIWLVTEIFVIFSLKKIISKFFNNDFLTFFLLFLFYITFRSGEIDQKTVSYPFVYFSIYYFFCRKYFIAFFLLAIIFYFHVGLGIWTAIPLYTVFFISEFRKSFKILFNYTFYFLVLISPIILFYVTEIFIKNNNLNNEILLYYWYGNFSNSLYSYFSNTKHLISFFLLNSFILFYFFKFKKMNKIFIKKNTNILYGILVLFFINFIFSDIGKFPAAIKLQLLRGDYILLFFSTILSCFFISLEAKKKNYLPLLIFIIFTIPNIIHFKLNLFQIKYLYISIIFVLTIFNKNNLYIFINKILNNIVTKIVQIKHNKIYIYIFLLFIIQKTVSYAFIDQAIKNNLLGKKRFLFDTRKVYLNETIKFINEEINEENVLFMVPFHETDIKYFIKYNILFSPNFLTDYHIPDLKIFNEIIITDLNLKTENLYQQDWKSKWLEVNNIMLNKWVAKYNLTHLIIEKEINFSFTKVFENKYYKIYDLRSFK